MNKNHGKPGDWEYIEPVITHDADTGRKIIRISPATIPSVAPYMYSNGFSADERYFSYVSEIEGISCLCIFDMASHLTRRIPLNRRRLSFYGGEFGKDCKSIYVLDDEGFYAIDMETFEKKTVFTRSSKRWAFPLQAYLVTPRICDKSFLFTFLLQQGKTSAGIAEAFVDSGEVREVYRYTSSVWHLQTCPADENLVIFCKWPDSQDNPNYPDEKRARTLALDMSNKTIRPYLVMPEGKRATHEYWSADGNRLYFHRKPSFDKGWFPTELGYMNRIDRKISYFFRTDSIMLGHSCVSPDDNMVISDSQRPKKNPLVRIDVNKGNHEVLCWPNASIEGGHMAYAHVHPSLSPRGTYISFTSDRSGIPQVYLIATNKEKSNMLSAESAKKPL